MFYNLKTWGNFYSNKKTGEEVKILSPKAFN